MKEALEPARGHWRVFKSPEKTQLIGLDSERDGVTGDPQPPVGPTASQNPGKEDCLDCLSLREHR